MSYRCPCGAEFWYPPFSILCYKILTVAAMSVGFRGRHVLVFNGTRTAFLTGQTKSLIGVLLEMESQEIIK